VSTRIKASVVRREATNVQQVGAALRSSWPGASTVWAAALQDLVNFLSELHALKIDLFLRTQGIDTTTPSGKAMFGMLSVFADFERSIIQERVRAGLLRARREGKRLGRPPIAEPP
jgi:DNA invertase Pin-like site-specific DNA recombinase